MSAPQSLGAWVAFLGRLGSVDAAIERALSIGARWIAPRAGEGGLGVNEGSFRIEQIKAYQSAGLAVYPWLFSRPRSWRTEVLGFEALIQAGADGVIIDAEAAWEDVDHRADARAYMAALRERLPDAWIADAPWPWEGMHPGFPIAEFAAGVDARLPQAYSNEIGVSLDRCIAEMDREWSAWEAAHPELSRARFPIFDTYSHVTPIHFAEVLARLDAAGNAPVSLYSLEAMDPGLLSALQDRARNKRQAADTDPAPAPETGPPAAYALQLERQAEIAREALSTTVPETPTSKSGQMPAVSDAGPETQRGQS